MTEQLDKDISTEATAADGSQYGKISINFNVIAMIARETAEKTPGVVQLQGSLTDDLAGMLGKKAKDRGVRIERESDEHLSLELSVILKFGLCIPDVCVQLQKAVKSAVEEMTGQQVFAVNVVVRGVENPEKKAELIEG